MWQRQGNTVQLRDGMNSLEGLWKLFRKKEQVLSLSMFMSVDCGNFFRNGSENGVNSFSAIK